MRIKLRSPRFPPTVSPSGAILGLTITLSLVGAFSHGLDWVSRPKDNPVFVPIASAHVNLDFVGTSFMIFAIIAAIGVTFEFWPLAIMGHGVIAVNYLSSGIGTLMTVLADWQGYGWNNPVLYLCLSAFHYLIADGCYGEWASEWDNSSFHKQCGEITGAIDDGAR